MIIPKDVTQLIVDDLGLERASRAFGATIICLFHGNVTTSPVIVIGSNQSPSI